MALGTEKVEQGRGDKALRRNRSGGRGEGEPGLFRGRAQVRFARSPRGQGGEGRASRESGRPGQERSADTPETMRPESRRRPEAPAA